MIESKTKISEDKFHRIINNEEKNKRFYLNESSRDLMGH